MTDGSGQNQQNDNIEPEVFVLKDTGIKTKRKIPAGYKVLITIAVLIIVGILYFCSIIFIKAYNKSKSRDEFYVQQEVLEYLKERYNEEFVVVYNRGMGPAYNYVQLYAYPKEYKDEKHKFEIQGYYNRWGKLDYYDSYVMVRLTDDYEAYIDPIIGEYFDEYKFYMEFDSEWLTSNLPPDTKLEDLWELRANEDYAIPSLFIYHLKKKISVDKVEKLCLELKDLGLRGRVKIWFLRENERYLTLDRNDWQDNRTYRDIDDITTIFLYNDRIEIMEE